MYEELDASKDQSLATVNAAILKGWLLKVSITINDPDLSELLDPGEVSSILYSLQNNRIQLLVDEHKGKQYTKKQGIPVIGTAGVLVQAKQNNLISRY